MKDFDDYIKKQLENINPPFDEQAELAWERLIPRLPQKKEPHLLPLLLTKIPKSFFVALSLGTLLLGSTLVFLHYNADTQNTHTINNKKHKAHQAKNQDNTLQKSGITQNFTTNDEIEKNQNTEQKSNTIEKNILSENKTDDNTPNNNISPNNNVSFVVITNQNSETKTQHNKENETIKDTKENNLFVGKNNQKHNLPLENINIFIQDANFITLKTISPKENIDVVKINNLLIEQEDKKEEKNAKEAGILKTRLEIDNSLPKISNKILVKNGFYIHQSQMIAPLIEANNRNIGVGLANEVIFNDKYSIFTTLGISQQKYSYQSSEAITNNSFFLRGNNTLNDFNTYVTQNMVAINIEGRIYPNFMFGKGFFGVGLPTQIIFQENRFDEGLDYWLLAQDKNKSNILNGFTHLSFSMGASVPLNSKTELQLSPVFQIPLYKIYKENISGYTFGIKGVVLLR